MDKSGAPSQSFRLYFLTLDASVRALVKGLLGSPTQLVAAADDAAAAAAGVPVGGLYRTPATGTPPHTISVVQIRVS
jgi:hypothetical protein